MQRVTIRNTVFRVLSLRQVREVSVNNDHRTLHIDTLIATDIPLFIHGSLGIGKSYIVADIAVKNGLNW